MWAAPFAPPPDSTRPTLGRDPTAVVSRENAVREINDSNSNNITRENSLITRFDSDLHILFIGPNLAIMVVISNIFAYNPRLGGAITDIDVCRACPTTL